MKIKGKPKGKINVKRFYVDGVTIESDCPKCKFTHTKDLGSDYTSYPVLGESHDVWFYCEEDVPGDDPHLYCDTEWEESVVLSMTVIPAKKTRQK